MAFLVFLLMVGLLTVWIKLSARFDELDHRLALLEAAPDVSPRLADLTARLWRLEQTPTARPEPATAPPPTPTPVKTEPRTVVLPPPPPLPPPTPLPPPVVVPGYVKPEPPRVVPPSPVELAPEPSLTSRMSTFAAGQEWEALLGRNLLNKIGAVLLVIGISLALGYSYARVTPAGRASMALAFSVALLSSGIWTERRPNYRVFARGLIGAGWAALYATSYAIYAIPASRIIDNPFAGSLGTVLVALGMIAHSLRYRNQALAGLAYFAAFAALAATPAGPFAVISLIPLAASLIYLAIRFEWHSMALFGLVATYGTCISRGSSNAPLAATQTLFLAYWAIFEALDLLRTRRRTLAGGVEWIFPLNTAGLLGLSYLVWSHQQPERLWFASACAAVLLLTDAIARALLRPPSSFEPTDDLFERFRYGSYEGSLMLSAMLAGLAVVGRVPGVLISGSLAVEAEILYLAGVRFRSQFVRVLGAAGFVCSAAWISMTDFRERRFPCLADRCGVGRRPSCSTRCCFMSTEPSVLEAPGGAGLPRRWLDWCCWPKFFMHMSDWRGSLLAWSCSNSACLKHCATSL